MSSRFTLHDKLTNKKYFRGKLIGKGGFATCYHLLDEFKKAYACKIISAAKFPSKFNHKMIQEIEIHRELDHAHIVKLFSSFSDSSNIYIVLELCVSRSLSELLKRRKRITECETRYFSRQIVLGVKYLHENNVIHRDLKLANVFLDGNMIVKIGDFGLAVRLTRRDEKRKSMCGTPNFIAPEVLQKKAHSFEVDIWSFACMVYTLLVGCAPFESKTLDLTCANIISVRFSLPSFLDEHTKTFISAMLIHNPIKRPTIVDLLEYTYFKQYIPNCLPRSALTTEPRFDNVTFAEINVADSTTISYIEKLPDKDQNSMQYINNLESLKSQITSLLKKSKVLYNHQFKTNSLLQCIEDSEDPKLAPLYWVSKWVDYSDKYGFGYMLNDESTGIIFNDNTKLVLTSNMDNLQYINESGLEQLYTMHNYCATLGKKVKLLNYFLNYMVENLISAGAEKVVDERKQMERVPTLCCFIRTSQTMALYLSNGIFQCNFTEDHSKLIFCPLMGSVSCISSDGIFKTFSFSKIKEVGISKEIKNKLLTVIDAIETASERLNN